MRVPRLHRRRYWRGAGRSGACREQSRGREPPRPAIAHDRFGQPLSFLRSHAYPNNETTFRDHGLDQLRSVSSEMPRGEGAQAPARRSRRGGRGKRGGQTSTGRHDTHRRDGRADREQRRERCGLRHRDIVTTGEARRGAPGTSAKSSTGTSTVPKRLRKVSMSAVTSMSARSNPLSSSASATFSRTSGRRRPRERLSVPRFRRFWTPWRLAP